MKQLIPKAGSHRCEPHHKEESHQEDEEDSGDEIDYQGYGGVGEDVVTHGHHSCHQVACH